jgi:glycine/D-amino acid oxidase-like deaminating enzyme
MSPRIETVQSDEALPESVDVVIIGAGIVGSAAAYYLAEKGCSVALLEKGVVAGEQSGRNWGWCREQMRSVPELPLARKALQLWDELSAEVEGGVGFRRTGMMVVTRDPAEVRHWEKWLEATRAYQIPGGILSGAEVRQKVPATTEDWIAGIYSPTDGWAEPAVAAPAIARAARKKGVSLHQNCAVRGWETKAGRVDAVVTERGRIKAAAVLCAGGAWTSMMLRHHGISFPQAGVYATAFRTETAPEVFPGGIGSPGFSFRRREDGGYTVAMRGRGRVEITPQTIRYARHFLPLLFLRSKGLTLGFGRSFFQGPFAFSSWSMNDVTPFERMRALDPEPDRTLIDRCLSQFRAAYPVMRDIGVAEAWGGLIDTTPDAVPVISGVEGRPGVFIASGFSGHGFALGPAAGRLAADLVRGDAPVVDPTPYRHARFFDGTQHKAHVWV